MSSLLRLAPAGKTLATDIEEDVWPRIKEFFTWAAQHPQLMGIALLFAGYIVKKSRSSGTRRVWIPGEVLGAGVYGPPRPGRYEEQAYTSEGMDFSLINISLSSIPGVAQAEGIVGGELSAFGVWLGTAVPALKPGLEQVKSGALGIAAGHDVTFGDLLLMGGAAALLGPILAPLLKVIP